MIMLNLLIGWRHPGGSNYLLPHPDNITGREVVSMKTCKVEGCERSHEALGYCEKHYKRFKKWGDPLYVKINMVNSGVCSIDGCNNKYHGLGFCSDHYLKFKVYGDPLFEDKNRHGMSGIPEYKVWTGMKQRCSNTSNRNYPRYGGRGITVCDRWKDSFTDFYEDMGSRPTPTHQIDRIDNDGNYEPDNCRWVTQKENARKQQRTKLTMEKAKEIRIKYKVENFPIKKLSIIYNVSISNINQIINNRIWVEG